MSSVDIKAKHVAVSFSKGSMQKLPEWMRWQVDLDIPIMTFFISRSEDIDAAELNNLIDAMHNTHLLNEKKMKISVLGKWYDLPDQSLTKIKRLLDETKDYDSFFVNLCINYDGQEEIVDACRLILRKMQAEKIVVDQIDKEAIKDSIYTSYFLPPDIILQFGSHKLQSFLLWDSANANIHFVEHAWDGFEKEDLVHVLETYA